MDELEPYKRSTDVAGSSWREKYRVRFGFFFGMFFIFTAVPRNLIFLILGIVVGGLGIFLRQWAAGAIRKMDQLAQTGPYALVRHPLYVGSFLAALGLILATVSAKYWERALLYLAFFWILLDSIYLPKILKEEYLLSEKFKEEYPLFESGVGRFVPRRWDWSLVKNQGFDWNLWKKNKEYKSIVGYALIAAILICRFIYGR